MQGGRPSPESRVGQVLADRYRLDELLGEGGMGVVYRGEHVHMRKTVAVKLLHAQMTAIEEVVKRFEREAVAAGRIEHANVAGATDFGRLDDGTYYLVLEYVAGQSLREVIDRDGPLPVDRALGIARQIAAALGAAHQLDIVHRDLKPDNIQLVERGQSSDFVKVLDFGIAKLKREVGTQLTQLGTVFGTPQYMSPEQASGKVVDARADLYALGLMLHEMLTGEIAFDAADLGAVLAMQMTQPPAPLPPGTPAGVQALVADLLEKQPDARIQTAAEVIARIDALLGGPPRATEPSAHSLRFALASARTALPAAAQAASPPATSQPGRWRVALGDVARRLKATSQRKLGPLPVWGWAALGVAAVVGLSRLGGETAAPDVSAVTSADPATPAEGASGDDEGEAEEQAQVQELDPELQRVIALAKQGSQPALFALEQRDRNSRTAAEWLALAQGRMKRREVSEGLAAYAEALSKDRSLASNRTLLAALRYFAEREATGDAVLEFAAERLGSHGADLLFHVWSSTSRKTRATQRARELLDAAVVQQNMSEPLRIAMSLRKVESCADYRELLPLAERAGDRRSLLPLQQLVKTDGCGENGKQDCYPCLRGDAQLKAAITQVEMRSAPRFTTRRWR